MNRPLLFLTFSALAGGAGAAGIPADQLQFFESRIRPVLAENCYRCHSQSEGKSKGGLTLDTRSGWKKGGDTGPALVPGKPEESLLIQAVRYADPDLSMPPKGDKLPEEQIAALEKWVEMGAPDPRDDAAPVVQAGGPMTESMKARAAKHWAFQPLKKPAVPEVKDTDWPANEVDRFVLAQLESQHLTPSGPADKRTLIRRAALDLTGLPPTPAEVMSFVADDSPEAFEKVIDRLLASPQYGERWGRFWLDVARYADTRGRMKQKQTPLNPNAWTYRDYVISAFNSDKPFDQFIREQIAADLLPDSMENPLSKAALGFITQGDQFQGNRPDIINDQIDVVTKGFLGLTVTCARCHDHKFDPVPQADYYSLYGIFNSSHEPGEAGKPIAVPSTGGQGEKEYGAEREKITEQGRRQLIQEMNKNASVFNKNARFFFGLTQIDRKSPEFYEYIKDQKIDGRLVQEFGQALVQKMNVRPAKAKQNGAGAGAGARRGGMPMALQNPVLGPLKLLLAIRDEAFEKRFPDWLGMVQRGGNGRVNPAISAAFADQQPKTRDEALDIYASVFDQADVAWKKESAGGKGIFPGLSDPALEQVRTAVIDPDIFLTGPIEDAPGRLPRETRYLLDRILANLARLDVSHAGAPGLANVLRDDARPKNSAVFLRGQIQTPGPVVPRQFLEVLSGPDRKPFVEGSGRLELAQAIASPENPLTPRVIVNRIWLHHFGEGFVSTPDDLGVMSGTPDNPALLDWLASEFVAGGWSVKNLHRTILLSKTWQQSSDPDTEKAKADPFNHLLWRQNVRRLEFEALRDSILFMGGKLDLTMGGHPVNIESEPYSPRRSVYGFIDRNEMAEFMRNFDVANAELPTGRRFTSIVPQQALFRMNSLLVIEQARNIMDRGDMKACATDGERLQKLYEIIYQRWPREKEVQLARAYLQSTSLEKPETVVVAESKDKATPAELRRMTKKERQAYIAEQSRKDRQQARAQMDKKRPSSVVKEAVRDPSAENVDRSPLTAWEKYAHALLMTNEMAYVN